MEICHVTDDEGHMRSLVVAAHAGAPHRDGVKGRVGHRQSLHRHVVRLLTVENV